jgi:nucleotide-binding universal stress UspA family protein
MFERIMVPLDGSIEAEITLPYAEEIASRVGAEIILASVSPHVSVEPEHLYFSYLERTSEQVQRDLEGRGANKEVKVETEVLIGNPATEILRYADLKNIGLIAMASRGRSSSGPWILGNVTARVLRATNKPVLLIRCRAGNSPLHRGSLVKRILVPLDGSSLGEVAVPYAGRLARVLGAELIFFQAFITPTLSMPSGEGKALSTRLKDTEETMRVSAIAYLDRVGNTLEEKEIITSRVAKLGTAANQILEYAELGEIDLIAMSTHGRSGFGRWVFGSVTDKVLHAGDTAVLTVRATKA